MQKLLALSIIFLSFTFCFSQEKVVSGVTWKTYASPKENFSVEVPQNLSEDFNILKDATEKEVSFNARYSLKSGEKYFYVFSEAITENAKPVWIPTNELNIFIEINNGKPEDVTIGNYKGLKYDFADNENYYHKVILINTPQRSYIFHAVGTSKTDLDTERFINSVKLDGKLASSRSPVPNPSTTQNQKGEGSGMGRGIGTGRGEGSGVGRGAGTGIGSGSGSNSTNQSSTPVRIISKPRASYTDLARKYQIQGTVALRVVFLANGGINAIPISRLPFGLTNGAIEAAKQMKFEPAKKNGVAYRVDKQVEYNFTLY